MTTNEQLHRIDSDIARYQGKVKALQNKIVQLGEKKKNWIDFNAGVLVEDAELEETGQKLFDYVIDVASGKKVRSEEAGFHDMAIFKQGVTL